ncbi:hypothetical protein I4F81_010046 [Pyropia yezoensis]|uniref:Uncharacterized protein n=1 Tax=Pyropia yezoensis TaxID=2788 RepID=A0ACC3CBJ5_PYRYE|nr:hypothetical protein I4F81_010046 [Neopyropia yezoensis]
MTGATVEVNEGVGGGAAGAAAGDPMDVHFPYESLATRVFREYEVLDDAARAVPITERRKNSRSGRFNTARLRALQQFVLGVGGAGLSVREQRLLYDFLEVWDSRDSADPLATNDSYSLQAVFPTISSFTSALRDDLIDAVLDAGWKKLSIREGAHKLYPVRARLVNDVSGEIEWMTIAYIPLVRIQVELAAQERSRLRRCGILQRVLYVCMRTAMAASRFGAEVRMNGRLLMAFPRVLLYVCDQPEERAVLCMKAGKCQRPCSQCDVQVDVAGSYEALNAAERDVVETLERQLEAAGHRSHNRERARRETLEAVDSLTGFVPALAAMDGLSTAPYLMYKMIGFDALHVLDLGVTRYLVQWLVEAFAKICSGDVPLAGTDAATRRVCNMRLGQVGRRSKACRTAPGYLVKLDETQAVFTGKQQRDGVSGIPHLVAGVWRSRGALHATDNIEQSVSPVGVYSPTLPVGDGIEDALPDLATRVAALHLDGPQEGEGDDASDGGGGGPFDWQAYRAVWQQTPVDQAITAMFAEFAVLHAEMSGYTCSTSPLPLTLDVGKCIANRAERFVTLYVTPILGAQHSTKIHRLLCHVMGAIRMHGNINNGNAGINEGLHKEDKPYYARTSKGIMEFTRQLVVQAQGARIIKRRNAGDDEGAAALLEHCRSDEDCDSDGSGLDVDEEGLLGDGRVDWPNGGVAEREADQAPAPAPSGLRAVNAAVRAPAYHLRRVPLSTIAQWPGLSGIAAALELPEDERVRLSSRISFMAVFECGWTVQQLLYASPCFRGAPWYDCVLYSPTPDASSLAVAEVRAIVRRPEGDVAVVADMAVVEGVPNCPLVSRGCTRLAWSVPEGASDICLRTLPLACVRRVVHVVPDFADMVERVGVEAVPPGWDAPVADRLAMRFFINAFYPWASSP